MSTRQVCELIVDEIAARCYALNMEVAMVKQEGDVVVMDFGDTRLICLKDEGRWDVVWVCEVPKNKVEEVLVDKYGAYTLFRG
jgi:hypothetical protein